MWKKLSFLFLILLGARLYAEDRPSTELLLPAGTLYAMASRSYHSLKLPPGWTVVAGAYTPDGHSIALVFMATALPPKMPHSKTPAVPVGPINKVVQTWPASARLCVIDRSSGTIVRTWRLSAPPESAVWTFTWIGTGAMITARPSNAAGRLFRIDVTKPAPATPVLSMADDLPQPPDLSNACPSPLAETTFKNKDVRFVVERSHCSTPPETSDFYRLVRDNPQTHKDAILWEYRVTADTATCAAPYACYSGTSADFLALPDQLFLTWDGDVFSLSENEDGIRADLVTQLLPQYGRPWGIAAGETSLNPLDLVNTVTFQPVAPGLSIPHTDNLTVYAQNLCALRGFNATIHAGPYTKSLMVPAGYQVGPAAIGDFKDRPYTPLLITATWTSFHHLAEPVNCAAPYTVLPTTKGLVVSITESGQGQLRCHVDFQED